MSEKNQEKIQEHKLLAKAILLQQAPSSLSSQDKTNLHAYLQALISRLITHLATMPQTEIDRPDLAVIYHYILHNDLYEIEEKLSFTEKLIHFCEKNYLVPDGCETFSPEKSLGPHFA